MNLGAALGSSIGRKMLNAITGLFFVLFVIGHLTGNFLLFVGPGPFNEYAHFLTHVFHGWALPVVEAGMVLFLLVHVGTGISVRANGRFARSADRHYEQLRPAKGGNLESVATQTMMVTGVILLLFIIIHVLQFKYGVMDPRASVDQVVQVDGKEVLNLYGRVVGAFAQPLWAIIYSVVMLMLGLHLCHGVWSAFQSLGLANHRYLPTLKTVGYGLATILAVGFLSLPTIMCLGNGYFQQLDKDYTLRYAVVAQSATNVPSP